MRTNSFLPGAFAVFALCGAAYAQIGLRGGSGQSPAASSSSINSVKNYGAKGDGVVFADGSMSALTGYTFSCSLTCYPSGMILEFSGVSSASPVDVSSSNGGTGSTISAASVTTTASGDRLITAYGFGGTGTFTAPAGVTQRGYVPYVNNLFGAWIGDQTLGAPGATGAVSGTDGSSVGFAAVNVALRPSSTISFLGAASAANSAGSSLNLAPPAGSVIGNMDVACLTYLTSATLTPPSGWALVGAAANGGGSTSTACFVHQVSGVDPGATLTSASATFKSADVGKLVCVDGTAWNSAKSIYTEDCGTILSFIDSHDVHVSFNNVGAAINGKEFIYATDDSAAIAAALVASCGERLYVDPGVYGASRGFAVCKTKGSSIVGSGAGLTAYDANLQCQAGMTPPSMIAWLTKSMTDAAGITIGGTGLRLAQENAAYRTSWVMSDIGLQAGVGCRNRDAGGASTSGVHIDHVSHIALDRVFVSGFALDGFDVDGTWLASVRDSWAINNGQYGILVENNGGGGDSQNVSITGSDISLNGATGIRVQDTNVGTIQNDIIQWNVLNGSSGSGGYYDLDLDNSCGIAVMANWIDGAANPKSIQSTPCNIMAANHAGSQSFAQSLPGYVASVDAAAQSTAIPATTLYSVPASSAQFPTPPAAALYELKYSLCTATAGSAGTASVSFAWNNGAAQSFTSATIALASRTSCQQGSVPVWSNASQNIQYSTAVSGAAGSPAYDLHITVQAVSQ